MQKTETKLMKIEYSKQAVKAIHSIDKKTKFRIKIAVEKLQEKDIKPLKDAASKYRSCVGD